MRLASLRLGILLATLVVSLHVAAAPRYWTLTGVQFNDGTIATGYFSHDDATQTIENWNVRVDNNWFGLGSITFLRGNSGATTTHLPSGGQEIVFASEFVTSQFYFYGEPGHVVRALRIHTLAPLDGSNPTVSLDLAQSIASFSANGLERLSTRGTAGSLTLTPVPPPVVIAQVDEFYNPALKHYFITADSAEKQALDTGVYPDWQRTGESFKAYAKGSSTSGSANPVCRFYSPPRRQINDSEYHEGSNSHFFSADAVECVIVATFWWYAWLMEGGNVFEIDLPDKTSGACPTGTIPVYRLMNERPETNHRYTTSATIKAQMLAAGYVSEGYGPDGVVMCAVH